MAVGVKETTKRVAAGAKRDDLSGEAAKVAFYAFLSLFPLMLVILSLTGLIGGQSAFDSIMRWLESSVPSSASGLLSQYVREITNQKQPGILSIGALLTLWSASAVFAALTEALDDVFDVEESRGFLKRRGLALLFAGGIGVVVVVVAVAIVGGPEIFSALGIGVAFDWIRWPIVFAVLAAALYAVYRWLPDRDGPRDAGALWTGAIAGAVLWVLATALFRLYVANFGSYSKTYGAVGAVIVLLLWLQISAAIILLGGEIAAARITKRAGTRAEKGAREPAPARPSYA